MWGFATKFTALPFFFVLNIVLTRMLGPELWGSWTYFFSFFTILYLLALFGVKSSQKYVAQFAGSDQLKFVLADSLKLRLILSSLFAAFVGLMGFVIPPMIGRPEFQSLFFVSTVLIFLSGFSEYFKGVFTGLHRVKFNFFITATEFSMKLLCVVLFLYWSLNLENIILGYALAVFAATGLGFYLMTRFDVSQTGERASNYLKEIFEYSLPLFVISLGFTVATEVDTIMLGLLSNDLEVGDYGIAKQLIIKMPHISYALAMGTMPLFAKITAENLPERKLLFSRVLKLNALIFIPGSILMAVLAPYYIPLLYGVEYMGAVLPIQILAVYVLIFTTSVFFNQFLDYQHRAKQRARNLMLSLFLNIGLNYLLIPEYGAIGAAISTSISYLPYLLLNIWEVRSVFAEKEALQQ